MRYLLPTIAILLIYVCSMAQKPEGAYRLTAATYGDKPASPERLKQETIIKIFKDGYWISAFFGRPDLPFNGTGGGSYKTKGNKYVETLAFYSWDTTAVGKTYTFDYSVSGNTYTQRGYINSDKYQNYLIDEKMEHLAAATPLNNTGIEGVWKMQSATWGDSKLGEGNYKDVEAMKIYAYPRFAYAYYNTKTHHFVGAGGGTYTFDGKTLNEHVEYSTWGPVKNADISIDIVLNGKTYTQTWGNNTENWKRIKN